MGECLITSLWKHLDKLYQTSRDLTLTYPQKNSAFGQSHVVSTVQRAAQYSILDILPNGCQCLSQNVDTEIEGEKAEPLIVA